MKIGSISLLPESTRQRSASIKLTELLLLVTRCLLIILLALLLAKPQWNQHFQANNAKGWVLMERQDAPEAYLHFKQQVDSLLQAGYRFHFLEKGFVKTTVQELAEKDKNSFKNATVNYWDEVSALHKAIPAGLPVYLYTTHYLNRFNGKRPAININLHWQVFTPADSVAEFIQSAYRISADSIHVIKGISRPSGNVFLQENIAANNTAKNGYQLHNTDSGLFISMQGKPAVAVDTTTLTVTIFTGKYTNDAAYLQAAIQAIQQFSRHKINIQVSNNETDIPAQQDWLFWLSEIPVPASIGAVNLFTYESGNEHSLQSWIMENGAGISNKISLYKTIETSTVSAAYTNILWRDGFGNPLLALTESPAKTFHFFSHIDPSWNDLSWHAQFPQLLFTLLYPEKTVQDIVDKRTISEQQLQPFIVTTSNGIDLGKNSKLDITRLIWLLVFLFFALERWLSFRSHTKEVLNG